MEPQALAGGAGRAAGRGAGGGWGGERGGGAGSRDARPPSQPGRLRVPSARLRRCRGSDSASRPPRPRPPPPHPSRSSAGCRRDPLMVGTNLASSGGGARRRPRGPSPRDWYHPPPLLPQHPAQRRRLQLREAGAAGGGEHSRPRLSRVNARRAAACTPIPPRLHPGCSWGPAWQPFSKGDCFRAG